MNFVRTGLAAAALAGLALTAGCGSGSPQTLSVTLSPQNNSGESGTATLTQTSAGVEVVVNLTGATGTQPTHIHPGTCDNLTPAPKWPLSNTVNGAGTTTVPGVTISQLLAAPYAINIHKSPTDLKDYVACGDIVKSS